MTVILNTRDLEYLSVIQEGREKLPLKLHFSPSDTHVTAVALTPSTTHPHTQAELERSPVRRQEQEQPDISPLEHLII